ncbi:MAG: T9SS type A sorting domain-containing protein, partial [Chitinophagaceae bacterium]
ILPGSNISVTGIWTRMDATKPSTATITLYKNGVSAGTTSVTTGNTWTIIVSSISSGDVFYAKAQATGESQCLQSNNVTAGCSSVPTAPVLTCASSKGISGTIQSGNTILIYLLPTTSASPTSIPLTTNITYPTATSFAFYVNGCSGGTNNVANGTYMLMASNGSCTSAPIFECISSGSSALTGLTLNAISVTTPIYPYQTSISGSGVASGNILHLFINGQYKSTITASSANFTFTGLTLNASDQIKIYLYSGSTCMTVSNAFTVSCYTQPPIITTNINGNLLSSATSVSGTSAYSGASVTLYKGTSPSGVSVGTASTNASGNWTISSLTLTAGENYYVVQTVSGCASPSSSSASVLAPTTVCPTITSSVTETSTSVSGTMPSSFTGTIRIYLDGTQIGSTSLTSATVWTINAPFTYPLYAGAVISVTAQASGGAAENFTCSSTATVSCTSPSTPDITPTLTAITSGHTVTFNVSTVTSNTWYALLDNTGASYATSVYRTTTSSFNLTTTTFTSAGTYNLNLTANKLTGCGASYQAATIIVSSVLPVTLINFEAAWQNGSVYLNWSTSSEQNVSHFEIEKSLDGNNFNVIGSVNAAGNSQVTNYYDFIDHDPGENKIYYRLKTVDLDGNKKYSKIVKLTLKPIIITSVTPNPFTTELNLKIVLGKSEQLTVRLFDALGKQMLLQKAQGQKGINNIRLHELGHLTKGLYFISISTEDQNIQQKLLKLTSQ